MTDYKIMLASICFSRTSVWVLLFGPKWQCKVLKFHQN